MTVVFTIHKVLQHFYTVDSCCYFLGLTSEDIGLKYDSQPMKFPDQSFIALKVTQGLEPKDGRLYLPESSWCIEETTTSYLEIVLGENVYIFAVSVQGFVQSGSDFDFTKKLRLRYSTDYQKWYNHTEDGDEWVRNFILH